MFPFWTLHAEVEVMICKTDKPPYAKPHPGLKSLKLFHRFLTGNWVGKAVPSSEIVLMGVVEYSPAAWF